MTTTDVLIIYYSILMAWSAYRAMSSKKDRMLYFALAVAWFCAVMAQLTVREADRNIELHKEYIELLENKRHKS